MLYNFNISNHFLLKRGNIFHGHRPYHLDPGTVSARLIHKKYDRLIYLSFCERIPYTAHTHRKIMDIRSGIRTVLSESYTIRFSVKH